MFYTEIDSALLVPLVRSLEATALTEAPEWRGQEKLPEPKTWDS